MENAIISTANSLDDVLEKLNKDEKEHKIGKKEMGNIFDNMLNDGDGTCKCFYTYNKVFLIQEFQNFYIFSKLIAISWLMI